MREILFKAKMINDGEWVYGSLITNLNNMAFIGLNDCIYSTGFNNKPNAINSHIFSVDPETLCQATGLDDSEGNKIFEGDIVRFENTIHLYECKWNKHRYEFAWYSDGRYVYPIGDMRQGLTITGNIHDKEE